MVKEKAVTKKDIEQLLDSQTKAILTAVDKKLEANQEEMATMVNTAVQGTQDLLVEKIDKGFDQVIKKINNISLNTVDVVHKEEFDKLEIDVKKIKKILAI